MKSSLTSRFIISTFSQGLLTKSSNKTFEVTVFCLYYSLPAFYFVECSFVDLPHLAANIYCAELGNRLRAFLVKCPPSSPSPPVADLVIATADFQKDLTGWNIRYIFLHIASPVFISIWKNAFKSFNH